MSINPSRVYLVLRQSRTFPETYPEFFVAEEDHDEAIALAHRLNTGPQRSRSGQEDPDYRYFVRTVWL